MANGPDFAITSREFAQTPGKSAQPPAGFNWVQIVDKDGRTRKILQKAEDPAGKGKVINASFRPAGELLPLEDPAKAGTTKGDPVTKAAKPSDEKKAVLPKFSVDGADAKAKAAAPGAAKTEEALKKEVHDHLVKSLTSSNMGRSALLRGYSELTKLIHSQADASLKDQVIDTKKVRDITAAISESDRKLKEAKDKDPNDIPVHLMEERLQALRDFHGILDGSSSAIKDKIAKKALPAGAIAPEKLDSLSKTIASIKTVLDKANADLMQASEAEKGLLKLKAEKPKAEAEKPKAEAEKPKAEAEKPKAEAEKPKAEAEKPKAEAEKPKAEAEKPKAEAEKPKAEAEKPKAEAEKPKAEAEKPKAEAEKPKAEAEKPKAEAEKPKAEAEKPKAEAEKPKAEAEKPKAEADKPKAEADKPKAEVKANELPTGFAGVEEKPSAGLPGVFAPDDKPKPVTELDKAKDDLAKTKAELDKAKIEAKAELDKIKDELARTRAELDKSKLEAKAELDKTKDELTKTKDELGKTKDELTKTKDELTKTKDERDKTKDELTKTKDELTKTKDELTKTKDERDKTKAELAKTQGERDSTKQELGSTKTELGNSKTELDKTTAELNKYRDKQTASGAVVRTSPDKFIEKIMRKNDSGNQISETQIAYQTDAAGAFVKDANNQRIMSGFSEYRNVGGQLTLVAQYSRDAAKPGDNFVLSANNGVTDQMHLPSSVSNVKFHTNGNMSYETSEKPGLMTIVRGDGTPIDSKSDRPEYQNFDAPRIQFDEEGRISQIVPTAVALASGGRIRDFSYVGQTNEINKVVVQNPSVYPGLYFVHEKQGNSQEWQCTCLGWAQAIDSRGYRLANADGSPMMISQTYIDARTGRPFLAPQGEHTLSATGEYTYQETFGSGADQKVIKHRWLPSGEDKVL